MAPSEDKKIAFWDEFVRACSGFHYREIVAISRACGITTRQVENWKYGQRYPDKQRAEDIIEWVKAGKPMEQQRPFPDRPML